MLRRGSNAATATEFVMEKQKETSCGKISRKNSTTNTKSFIKNGSPKKKTIKKKSEKQQKDEIVLKRKDSTNLEQQLTNK